MQNGKNLGTIFRNDEPAVLAQHMQGLITSADWKYLRVKSRYFSWRMGKITKQILAAATAI